LATVAIPLPSPCRTTLPTLWIFRKEPITTSILIPPTLVKTSPFQQPAQPAVVLFPYSVIQLQPGLELSFRLTLFPPVLLWTFLQTRQPAVLPVPVMFLISPAPVQTVTWPIPP